MHQLLSSSENAATIEYSRRITLIAVKQCIEESFQSQLRYSTTSEVTLSSQNIIVKGSKSCSETSNFKAKENLTLTDTVYCGDLKKATIDSWIISYNSNRYDHNYTLCTKLISGEVLDYSGDTTLS